jgi:hypothetical protein
LEPAAIYKYEKYSFRIITPLLALIAFVFLGNGGYIVASIIFLLGALTAFSYQGVIIDPEKKRYMKYDRFLHFRIGGWRPLTTPSYVTLVRINLSNARNAPAPFVMPQGQKDARAFKVNLVVEGDERYISICRGTLEKMTREALRLGGVLQLRVLDFTTSEKKWIK